MKGAKGGVKVGSFKFRGNGKAFSFIASRMGSPGAFAQLAAASLVSAPPAPVVPVKKTHFAYGAQYSMLRTKGIEYFALYRNNGMDLEVLKSDVRNVEPFVYPLATFLKKEGICHLAIAPKGDRTRRNGFHFVTELIVRVQEIYPALWVYAPFDKKGSLIFYNKTKLPADVCIFDDIVTFGTTIMRMSKFLGVDKRIFILLTNH